MDVEYEREYDIVSPVSTELQLGDARVSVVIDCVVGVVQAPVVQTETDDPTSFELTEPQVAEVGTKVHRLVEAEVTLTRPRTHEPSGPG